MHKISTPLWVYMCMRLSMCMWSYMHVHMCMCAYISIYVYAPIFSPVSKMCVLVIQRRVRRKEVGLKTGEREGRRRREQRRRKVRKKKKKCRSPGTWPSFQKWAFFQPFSFTRSNCSTSTIGWWGPIQFMLSVHFSYPLPLICISQWRSQRSNVAGGLRWSLSDSIRAENYSWLKE